MVSNVHSHLRAGIAGRRHSLSLSRLALFAVIGPSLFGILIAFQDIVEWNWLTKVGWNPLSVAPVSDLAWSPIGGLQIVNFFVFGCATLTLAFVFHRTVRRNRFTYPALGVLVLIGIALVTSSARCDCISAARGQMFLNPPPLQFLGLIHNVSFYALALPVVFGPWLVWARLRKDARFRAAAVHSLLQGVVMVPLMVAVFSGPLVHFSVFHLWLLAWFFWQTHLAVRVRQVATTMPWQG